MNLKTPMNRKATIVFRADGNSEIGLGHVMRCVALCEMLQDVFYVKFAIQNPSAPILQLLQSAVSEVIPLPETKNHREDAAHFLTVLSKEDIVVLDGYAFDAAYQKAIKQQCRSLVYIDDLVSGHQYADVLINHNGLVQAADYDASAGTTFLLGTGYALVRKVFFDKRTANKDAGNKIKKTILINLGGADPDNISLKIVHALLAVQANYSITLILGAANKNGESFKPFQASPDVIIKRSLSAEEMIDEINSCTVAIVSCSTIAYEVCILNKPFIGVLTAANQASNAAFFKKNNLSLDVLDKNVEESVLVKSLEFNAGKWDETLNQQKLFFDGKTAERFQQAFKKI
jgi:UDP-2,4-diacetamido-2,4,6-trideoxy-beta-L-altropyranose hydrolase